MLPLRGITVVALEQAVAVPLATRQLADLGARVIKIERPGTGDFARHYDRTVRGMSSHFVWINRNKESVALELTQPAHRRVLDALLGSADVFVQNLGPGAAERLDLGPDALRARYPRLVACGLSGFGTVGPYRDKRAYDLVIQCETGVASITGTPSDPAKAGIPIADIAGGMQVFSGILAALYQRERTGTGSAIEVSMFDALADWAGFPLYYTMYGGEQPARAGLEHPAIAPYGPYRVGDGTTVVVAVQNDNEWARLCADVLDRPDAAVDERFASNDRRAAHRETLRELIEEAFAGRTAEEVVARLDAARIASAELRDIHGLAEHPQLLARDRWRTVDSPVGPVRTLLPPVGPAGGGPREVRLDRIPALGEDTAAVVAELGLPDLD